MEFCFHSCLCQLVALSLCCLLLSVGEAESTFVPGRCLCPQTQRAVRGPIIDLIVTLKGPSCNEDAIIVVLKKTKQPVCVSPEGLLGKQLLRCWKRATQKGLGSKPCLRRLRKAQRSWQRKQRDQARKPRAATS